MVYSLLHLHTTNIDWLSLSSTILDFEIIKEEQPNPTSCMQKLHPNTPQTSLKKRQKTVKNPDHNMKQTHIKALATKKIKLNVMSLIITCK